MGLIPISEDLLEYKMATHSNILAWKITWTEEPGGLQSMVSQRIGHSLSTEQQKTMPPKPYNLTIKDEEEESKVCHSCHLTQAQHPTSLELITTNFMVSFIPHYTGWHKSPQFPRLTAMSHSYMHVPVIPIPPRSNSSESSLTLSHTIRITSYILIFSSKPFLHIHALNSCLNLSSLHKLCLPKSDDHFSSRSSDAAAPGQGAHRCLSRTLLLGRSFPIPDTPGFVYMMHCLSMLFSHNWAVIPAYF